MRDERVSASAWKTELAGNWPLLVAATLGCGVGTSSLLFYGLGVFVEPLQQHFAWTRGEVSSALFYGGFGLALVAPLLGWLIDRLGVRTVALCSIPCFTVILSILARFDGTLAAFYTWFVLAVVLGSGTTPILYTRAVNGRFDAARGLALGITLAGPGTAAVLLPPFLSWVIASYGWRTGFGVLAIAAATAWPLMWFGLHTSRSTQPRSPASTGVSRRVALRSRIFWTIAFCFASVAAAAAALVVHMVPMLHDAGIAPQRAARIASLIGMGIILGRVGIGWMIDRVFAPRVAAVIFITTAAGCLLLAYGGPGEAPLAAFLVGFALGAEVDLMAYLTARYFGLTNYGFLYATVYAGFWLGIATGPALAGQLYDAFGNYHLALWVIVLLLLCGTLAAVSLPPYPARSASCPAEAPQPT